MLPLPAETNLELDWTNPQWLEAGLKYTPEPGHHWLLMANWQEWSEFSENQITVDVGSTSGNTTLDRDWDDTYGVAIGYARTPIKYGYGWSVGVAYESSPVEDDKRTIDMPMDESWKISAAFGNQRENKFDWSVGASLYFYGDAELDQTSQGVRLTGDFNQNMILFLGATARF